jgi:CBS domain-containing protein
MTSNPRHAPRYPATHLVGQIATRTNQVLHPDYPLDEAFARIRHHGSTFIPVADGVQIVGIFHVRGLARFSRKTAHDRRRLAVRDRMTAPIPFLYEDDSLGLAAAIAAQTGVAHFCVVDRRHRLTGTLSLRGKGAVAPPIAEASVDPGLIRRRFVATPTRAARGEPGDLGSYATVPVLHVSKNS